MELASPSPRVEPLWGPRTRLALVVGAVAAVTLLHYLTGAHLLEYHTVNVLEDLTGRRALEAQLRRMDRLASVGQLAAGIAHEVRNPLAILRATAQLLAGQISEQGVSSSYARVLIEESDRIECLISQLLEYVRPRPPHRASLDLHELLVGAVHDVRPYALQHEVALEVEAPQAPLLADDEQLRQALVNLLLNAVQATPPGGSVRVSATASATMAVIAVAASGRGMPPEVRERACDPFFTTRPDGTGLSLALVAAIVQEHGGLLSIASAPGASTTVTLRRRPAAPADRLSQ